jgi:hypothetical protein
MRNIRKRIEILEPSIPSSCGRETQDRIGQPAQDADARLSSRSSHHPAQTMKLNRRRCGFLLNSMQLQFLNVDFGDNTMLVCSVSCEQ